jgi:hypothetical protein
MLVAWLSSALLAAFGSVRLPAVAATDPPRPVTPPPPPCWCGRLLADHTATTTHDYAPAQGVESEAYDAW